MTCRRMSFALAFLLISILGCGADTRTEPDESGAVRGASPSGNVTAAGGSEPDSPAPEAPEPAISGSTKSEVDDVASHPAQDDTGGQGSEALKTKDGAKSGEEIEQDVATQVRRLLQQRKTEEAFTLLDKHAASEDAPAALIELATQAYQAQGIQLLQTGGDEAEIIQVFLKSWENGRRLLEKSPDLQGRSLTALNNVFYNGACALAMSGRKEEAIAALKQSLDMGFDDLKLLQTDESLAALKDDKEFKALVSSAIKKASDKSKPLDSDSP